MLGKNMTNLINMLEENEWEYEITNDVFYMVLSNDEEIFHVSNEERAEELVEILESW